MPVIRGPVRGPSLTDEKRAELIDKLEKELAGNSASTDKVVWDVPLIFEIPLERLDGSSDRMDVLVVWDAFEGLRSEERSALILDAYHEQAEKIVQALGATRMEATEEHLVPYQIRQMGEADPGEAAKAMLAEGGFKIGNKIVLRLPTRKMAEAALGRLYERLPKGNWVIAESIA
jgi:hypothetical protein